ncbi:MAG: hypothetical protein KAH31_11955 [Candidatus Sabulitectum sp.]|nr:hypothetical protein [Candidatus Sabulitectum sp.]
MPIFYKLAGLQEQYSIIFPEGPSFTMLPQSLEIPPSLDRKIALVKKAALPGDVGYGKKKNTTA